MAPKNFSLRSLSVFGSDFGISVTGSFSGSTCKCSQSLRDNSSVDFFVVWKKRSANTEKTGLSWPGSQVHQVQRRKVRYLFKCYLLLAQKKKIASGVHMPKELLQAKQMQMKFSVAKLKRKREKEIIFITSFLVSFSENLTSRKIESPWRPLEPASYLPTYHGSFQSLSRGQFTW